MKPEDLVATTSMTLPEAKEYLAVMNQIQKLGNYDDTNMEIMHQAILAEAKAQSIAPVRMAISMLFDFRDEARKRARS